jgi:hypothetical protein
MSGGDQKLSGPDLSDGIDPKELADGAMLVGHAHGEAVLLARRGAAGRDLESLRAEAAIEKCTVGRGSA